MPVCKHSVFVRLDQCPPFSWNNPQTKHLALIKIPASMATATAIVCCARSVSEMALFTYLLLSCVTFKSCPAYVRGPAAVCLGESPDGQQQCKEMRKTIKRISTRFFFQNTIKTLVHSTEKKKIIIKKIPTYFTVYSCSLSFPPTHTSMNLDSSIYMKLRQFTHTWH